jgi:ribosome-binding factor A
MGDAKEAQAGLERVKGILRHHLATTLNLRITPDLIFANDSSLEHGAHIAKLLKQIDDDRAKFANAEENTEEGEDE